MKGMTPYEKAARDKRAREREEQDARFTYETIAYLEVWINGAPGPYCYVNPDGSAMDREAFLGIGYWMLLKEIRARQRAQRPRDLTGEDR